MDDRIPMEKETMTQISIGSYRVGPGTGTDVVFAVVGALVLLLFAGIVMGPNVDPVLLFLPVAAFLSVPALLRLTTSTTTVEIDSAAGLVRKMAGPFLWKKLKTYPLRNIDAVRFLEKDIIVEEGYGVTSYTIVLESNNSSQELLSTNDEQQGRALYRELVALTTMSRQRTD